MTTVGKIASLALVLVLVGAGLLAFKYWSFPASVNEPLSPAPNPEPFVALGCYVSGCSGQICSEQQGAISTCEYKEEYACYKTARCERQTNGQCGWTQTPALAACLGDVQ